MKNQYLFLIIGLVLLGAIFGVYQYFQAFQVENVSAVTVGRIGAGHNWSSMECSPDTICIDTANKRVGIGTNTPSKALEVNGDIKVSGDVCTASGVCLSVVGAASAGTSLVNGVHNFQNCADAGGTVVSTGQIGEQCRFDAATCPVGWTRFRLWSTTTAPTVTHEQHTAVFGTQTGTCAGSTNTGSIPIIRTQIADATVTAAHAWSDAIDEVKTVGWTSYQAGPATCVIKRICNAGIQSGTTEYPVNGGYCCCTNPPNYYGFYGYFVPTLDDVRLTGTISSTPTVTQIGCY